MENGRRNPAVFIIYFGKREIAPLCSLSVEKVKYILGIE